VRKAEAEKCRKRAEECRINAANARSEPEATGWLDLADDWVKLAEALEQEDRPQWKN
jgi:hypothetical protein